MPGIIASEERVSVGFLKKSLGHLHDDVEVTIGDHLRGIVGAHQLSIKMDSGREVLLIESHTDNSETPDTECPVANAVKDAPTLEPEVILETLARMFRPYAQQFLECLPLDDWKNLLNFYACDYAQEFLDIVEKRRNEILDAREADNK